MTDPDLNSRMRNVVAIVPEAMYALRTIRRSADLTGISPVTIILVTLRASRINACGVCVDVHGRMMRASGESEERIAGVWKPEGGEWKGTPPPSAKGPS